jgi:hypothetical protein
MNGSSGDDIQGRKSVHSRILRVPLEMGQCDVLGVMYSRHIEPRVDLQTSTFVRGRTSHRVLGQEVKMGSSPPQGRPPRERVANGCDHPGTTL